MATWIFQQFMVLQRIIGWERLEKQTDSIEPLLDMVLEHVPSPEIKEGNTQMLITSLDFSSFTGRIAIGRLQRGH